MFKNLGIFLMLLFVSVQIAWSKPDRIISLSPTATEMLFAIGAGGNVVAVDSHSNFPKDAPLTKLSALEPNLEAIASYKPDLVIIAFEIGNLKVDLNAVGIEVLMLPATPTVEDALKQILEIGDITGNEENAEKLAVKIRSRIKTISLRREGKVLKTKPFSITRSPSSTPIISYCTTLIAPSLPIEKKNGIFWESRTLFIRAMFWLVCNFIFL